MTWEPWGSCNLQLVEFLRTVCTRSVCLQKPSVKKSFRACIGRCVCPLHHTEAQCGYWPLVGYMIYASATFANKLETCNVKLERLCEKPQRLKTDLCDIPLLEEGWFLEHNSLSVAFSIQSVFSLLLGTKQANKISFTLDKSVRSSWSIPFHSLHSKIFRPISCFKMLLAHLDWLASFGNRNAEAMVQVLFYTDYGGLWAGSLQFPVFEEFKDGQYRHLVRQISWKWVVCFLLRQV